MSVTIKHIAGHLGLSDATVSRILNNKPNFRASEKTREAVFRTAAELGYVPNPAARSLVTGRTNLIAFWASHLVAPFFLSVVQRLQPLLRADGFELITGEWGPQIKTPASGGGLADWRVDGALTFTGASDWLLSLQSSGRMASTPIVDMGSYCSRVTDYVSTDLYEPSRQAVEHLVSLGGRRVAHACTYSADYTESRAVAYFDVMKACGMKPEMITLHTLQRSGARESIQEYVERHGCPDAIFCSNDDLAIGICKGVKELGLRIPDDVAIVGCDGIDDLLYMDPPISTIVQPVNAMCDLAWEFLKKRLADPSLPQQTANVDSYLVIRESSGGKGCTERSVIERQTVQGRSQQ